MKIENLFIYVFCCRPLLEYRHVTSKDTFNIEYNAEISIIEMKPSDCLMLNGFYVMMDFYGDCREFIQLIFGLVK